MSAEKQPSLLHWEKDVASHDYDSALAYLSIRLDPRRAELAVDALRGTEITHRRVNDILRGCRLPALTADDPGVLRDLQKAFGGEKLSPVLVVSYSNGGDIADGYHRVSLAYMIDPFSVVPCRMAHVPGLEDELTFLVHVPPPDPDLVSRV